MLLRILQHLPALATVVCGLGFIGAPRAQAVVVAQFNPAPSVYWEWDPYMGQTFVATAGGKLSNIGVNVAGFVSESAPFGGSNFRLQLFQFYNPPGSPPLDWYFVAESFLAGSVIPPYQEGTLPGLTYADFSSQNITLVSGRDYAWLMSSEGDNGGYVRVYHSLDGANGLYSAGNAIQAQYLYEAGGGVPTLFNYGNLVDSGFDFGFQVNVVPEPSAPALALLGLAGFYARRRRW
jgi:hypothetical protein